MGVVSLHILFMPNYLGTLTNKELKTGREITNQEYNQLVQFSDRLRLFGNCQTLFKIFLFNFTDLFEYLNSANAPLNMTIRTSQFDEIIFNINRHLSNTLAAFRAYVDHIPSQLNRRFGKDSPQRGAFDRKTSELFDTFFEYRFFTKFRNYTQHREYYKYYVEYKADLKSMKPESSKGFYYFSLDPQVLLNSYDSWGRCKQDLKNMSSPIDLKSEINKLASIMTHLDMFVSNFYLDDLNETAEYFKRTFHVDDFLNFEYCIVLNFITEGKKHTANIKHLATEVISTQLRKVKAYQQIENNRG